MDVNNEFDDIRPYYDEEFPEVIDRLLIDPEFRRVVQGYVLPDMDWDQFTAILKSTRNRHDFQHELAKESVNNIVGRSSDSINAGGLGNLEKGKPQLFMSNHRDIVLDASLMTLMLIDNGFETMEIAIGDNLLLQPWIEDLVRLNKSFIVKRGVSFREQLAVSTHLSKYIHYAITKKEESVWIAQREGRAKDSNDHTQDSVLKMLAMGSDKDFVESIRELNVVPVSLSYEYDPCDFLKAKEFQQKRDNPEFKKTERDDLLNMETGLFGYKGRIYFHFGKPINPSLDSINLDLNKNEKASIIAELIDSEIYRNYQFYPINYISYDRIWGEGKFAPHYSQEDIERIDRYIDDQLDKIDLPNKDMPFLRKKIYEMYANPLKNNLSLSEN